MRTPPQRQPVEWSQLCRIASTIFEADPQQPIAEWSEAIKCRILRLELTYPADPAMLTRAMQAVQVAYEKRHGRIPVILAPRPTRARPRPAPLSHPEAIAALARIAAGTRSTPPSRAYAASSPHRWCRAGAMLAAFDKGLEDA